MKLPGHSLPLYNSRIVDIYIKLIKRKYSYINISELLSYARMELYQVEDEGHWFTQEQIDLFHDRLQKLTGNKDIAREAGRYSASPDALGVMRQYVLSLVGPAKAYEIIGKVASNLTRSSRYESRPLSSNQVEITVTPNQGSEEKPFQCESRMGFFEAGAMVFNYKLPNVEHTECMFKGGKACRYLISWEGARSVFWNKVVRISAFLAIPLLAAGVFLHPLHALTMILPLSLAALSLLNFYAVSIEKGELNSALESLRGTSDKLLEQINLNYNNSLTINEVGQALSKQVDINNIFEKVIQTLNNRLDYDRGLIFLANQDKTGLVFQTGFGYTYDQFNLLKTAAFHLDNPASKGVFIVSYREQKPILVSDIEEIEGNLSTRSLEFARLLGTRSFICCPIVYEEESLGVLVVDNINKKRPLNQSDINLLMGITPEIGISIHNARLIDDAVRQFKSVIHVLAATIDARDPLTAGHSEKVADYSAAICRELQLPKDYTEMVQIAALLHDYGKIGIDDNILKKAGRLTAEETEIIQTHADKTKSILERMDFKGIYSEIPEIAWSHHEKIDGSGYPRRLKGEEIPLGARIIAVADFFEAITAKRHYRNPMPLNEAIKLLRENIGSSFDEKIVEGFIKCYKRRIDYEDYSLSPLHEMSGV